jgi:hypothetical protein
MIIQGMKVNHGSDEQCPYASSTSTRQRDRHASTKARKSVISSLASNVTCVRPDEQYRSILNRKRLAS